MFAVHQAERGSVGGVCWYRKRKSATDPDIRPLELGADVVHRVCRRSSVSSTR
jgi:hypothetical protein